MPLLFEPVPVYVTPELDKKLNKKFGYKATKVAEELKESVLYSEPSSLQFVKQSTMVSDASVMSNEMDEEHKKKYDHNFSELDISEYNDEKRD